MKTRKLRMKTKKGGTNTIVQTQTQQSQLQLNPVFPGIGNTLGGDPLFDFINEHTHSLESVILPNFKNVFIDGIYVNDKDSSDYTETRRVDNKLVLSDASAQLLCEFNINRNVMMGNTLTYVPELHYDPKKSYILECNALSYGKKYGGGEFDVLLYKYQDPVVRMVCEYMMLLYDMFYTENIDIDKIYGYLEQYIELQKSIAEKRSIPLARQKHKYHFAYAKNNFWKFIRDVLMRKTRSLHPTTSTVVELQSTYQGFQEGTHCKFGVGLTNCCEETLTTHEVSAFMKGKFDTRDYDRMKDTPGYQNYMNMEPDFAELFLNPQSYLKQPDEKLIKFIAICQEVIHMIIIQSGRAEGKSVTFEPYPPISVLEVFEPTNVEEPSTYVWIIRSERFHLSKSPCVHLGLKGNDITDKLSSFFCLPPSYETNVILHSIGHCLDRLYCGHRFSSGAYTQANDVIMNQIINCFAIFLQRMSVQHSDYGDSNFQKLHIHNLTPALLYYISIQDIDSLEGELTHLKKTIPDIYKNPDIQITDLYDINFSFVKSARGIWETNTDCWTIKKTYGCSKMITRDRAGAYPV